MIARLSSLLRHRDPEPVADEQALDDHTELGWQAGRVLDAYAADPEQRRAALEAWAGLELARARTHWLLTGGPDPNPDEDGRDVADSIRSSGLLLWHLATALDPDRAEPPDLAVTTRDLGRSAALVLEHIWFGGPNSDRLGTRLADLYAATEPVIGGQAAEVLAPLVAIHNGPPLADHFRRSTP